MCLLLPLLDELTSGFPTAGAPELDARFAAGTTVLVLALFFAPQLGGLLIEPPILAWSDRVKPRRHLFVAGAFAAMAIAFLIAARTESALGFAIAYGCYGPASGIALGVAQAIVVDESPNPERSLRRWTIFAEVGDVLAPLLVALIGLTQSFDAAAILLLVLSAVITRIRPDPSPTDPTPATDLPSLREAFRAALGRRGLLAWLFACALCTFLDEIIVVFGGLFLARRFPDAPIAAAWIAFAAGGVVGLLLIERLRPDAGTRPRLVILSLLATAALAWLLIAPSPTQALALLFVLGAAAAPMYPSTLAAAHRALPGQPGMVGAISGLFSPIDFVAPIALGLIADTTGPLVATAALLVQPLGILAVALASTTDGDAVSAARTRGSRVQ